VGTGFRAKLRDKNKPAIRKVGTGFRAGLRVIQKASAMA